MPCSIHGFSAASSGSNSMIVICVGIDVDVLQQNRQRAPRDEAKAHEQDAIRKRLHRSAPSLSFFTSTLEFRPLCSYFSRRAGGRSSGVPSTNPPLDWKYVNACVESASSSRRPSSRARLSTILNQLAPDALVLVRRADVQAGQLALVLFGVHVQGDARDRILVDFEDEVVAEALLDRRLACASRARRLRPPAWSATGSRARPSSWRAGCARTRSRRSACRGRGWRTPRRAALRPACR